MNKKMKEPKNNAKALFAQLSETPRSANEIAQATKMSLSYIRMVLSILMQLGIAVSHKKKGEITTYSLNKDWRP